MDKEAGDRTFEIWLLGDSNPKQWQSVLSTPLDPRHPARHNIWTPVLDVIQDAAFRKSRQRVDTLSLYIRNAIENPDEKPRSNVVEWGPSMTGEIDDLRMSISEHHPIVLFSFGAFAFESARRSQGEEPSRPYSYWGARALGNEFRKRIEVFDPTVTNLLPLLHVSISRGRFIQAHEQYCDQAGANYFEFAGTHIADKLLEHRQALHVWIS
ncbi:MAG TPA: hypothetical protein VMW58_06230 [Anaerolineae bacterium]|nr:hypothetical protein [Anaerolineae bacterium]